LLAIQKLSIAQAKIEGFRNEVKPMTVRQPRYSKEEFARRGNEIYESQVRQQINEESDRGKIVAIDIETGAFEVAEDLVTAAKHLCAQVPDAQTWFVRIGHLAVDHFGARSLRTKP
jgi:FKBP-type peptidyl-prolyl cis-trans isomerase (trigger factor)